jgi:rubredoxin
MTWVLLIFTALMTVWAIAAASSGSSCDKSDPDYESCKLAEDIGTGIGITLIFVLWFIGFIVLGLIWLMSRPKHRQCPRCGHDVKKGLTVCKNCGYDFAAATGPPAVEAAPPD